MARVMWTPTGFVDTIRSGAMVFIAGMAEENERSAHARARLHKAAGESQTSLTAEPLNLDYQHEIIRRINQEPDQAPPSGPKCSERSGIDTSSRSSRGRWYCAGSTITTAVHECRQGCSRGPGAGRRNSC
jgi:hypothetical protein